MTIKFRAVLLEAMTLGEIFINIIKGRTYLVMLIYAEKAVVGIQHLFMIKLSNSKYKGISSGR